MNCHWCEKGDESVVLDEDGKLSSLSGKSGAWGHGGNWWTVCRRKAAELRALEVLAIEWVRAEQAAADAIEAQGYGLILGGSAADFAVKELNRVDDEFRAACRELSKAADDESTKEKT